jgi:hypothetical protein
MNRPEQELHKAVVAHIRARGVPGLVWWHTPNGAFYGGRRNRKGIAIQGAIMKGLGARAGVADLVFLHDGRAYALELKSADGRPIVEQMQFISDFNAAGGHGCICDDLDRALRVLETWGILVGRAA